jgi:hypothetical protein
LKSPRNYNIILARQQSTGAAQELEGGGRIGRGGQGAAAVVDSAHVASMVEST